MIFGSEKDLPATVVFQKDRPLQIFLSFFTFLFESLLKSFPPPPARGAVACMPQLWVGHPSSRLEASESKGKQKVQEEDQNKSQAKRKMQASSGNQVESFMTFSISNDFQSERLIQSARLFSLYTVPNGSCFAL